MPGRPVPSRLAALALLPAVLLPVACGGGEGEAAGGSPAMNADSDTLPAGTSPGSGPRAGDTLLPDTLGRDTTTTPPRPALPGDPDTTASAPGGRRSGSGTEGPLPAWTSGDVRLEASAGEGVAPAIGLRTGSHEGYDRVVIEFAGAQLPDVEAGYVDRPLRACGSGREIRPVGDGWLQVHLQPARGHTEEGEATLPPETATEGLARVRRIYRTCDFEGVVTLVLAVTSPNPYRAFTLDAPGRVVVDVRR